MPYGRRTYRKRQARKNRKKTKAIIRNRSSKDQAFQIVALNKKVMRLNNRVTGRGNYFNYYNEFYQTIPGISGSSVAGYGYNVIPFHPDCTTWNRCLNEPTASQLTDDRWRLHRTYTQMRFDVGTELAPIDYTVFIVKVKPNMRQMAYENWGPDLSGFFAPTIAATPTPDAIAFNPINTFDSGLVCINQHVFKVIKQYRFTLGQEGYGSQTPAVRNIRDTVKHIRFTTNYGGRRGITLTRSTGEVVDGLQTSIRTLNQRARVFCIVVTNNATIDLQTPQVSVTNLHTLSSND